MLKSVLIDAVPGFEQWRLQARSLLYQGIPPEEVRWVEHQASNILPGLFESIETLQVSASVHVPLKFVEQARLACCHTSPERFTLLYRLLWRQVHGNIELLNDLLDDDVMALKSLVKAVGHDAYKIKAFLRFRHLQKETVDHYIAWYEPEFYTVELVVPFFAERFPNMRWAILTPYITAQWDGKRCALSEPLSRAACPSDDAVEALWLQYYASTFNPARIKTRAMLSQMPKKYWKTMPETVQIPQMLADAPKRVTAMLKAMKPNVSK